MPGRFPFLRSNPETQLGPLEHKLLDEVWSRGSVTVRELVADGKLRQAYTTIMTTLDRLFKKRTSAPRRRGQGFPLLAALYARRIPSPGGGGRDPPMDRVHAGGVIAVSNVLCGGGQRPRRAIARSVAGIGGR